jgi:hypothetical protein
VAKVSVEIGLTLSLKGRIKGATDYEFIRPNIRIADIDTEGDLTVKEQLALAKKAIRPVWDLVDAAVEKLCEETFNEE